MQLHFGTGLLSHAFHVFEISRGKNLLILSLSLSLWTAVSCRCRLSSSVISVRYFCYGLLCPAPAALSPVAMFALVCYGLLLLSWNYAGAIFILSNGQWDRVKPWLQQLQVYF